MKNITSFRAVYTGGIVIPNEKAVTALSLLFEKIYLPINIEFLKEFAKNYKLVSKKSANEFKEFIKFTDEEGNEADPLKDLTKAQKETAINYLKWAEFFSIYYLQLYEEVFETNAYEHNSPYDVKMVKKGKPGKKNLYRFTKNNLLLTEGDENNIFTELFDKGYVPLASNFNINDNPRTNIKASTAKSLAALIAMKSIEIVLPDMKAVNPEIILEARNKLSNHLPPFWSSMLKLSIEMKKCLKDCNNVDELFKEGTELVDTTVRPALIELNRKIELERKNWFYKILEPVGKGIRILIGHPGLTMQELMASSLLMSTEIASSTMENMKIIDKLKSDSGLTYLIELNKLMSKKA